MALQLSAMHRDALNELHSSGDEDAGILATIVGFALDSKDGSEDLDQATIDEIERKLEHSQKDPGVVMRRLTHRDTPASTEIVKAMTYLHGLGRLDEHHLLMKHAVAELSKPLTEVPREEGKSMRSR
jgi:hypothetical protein